MPKPNGQRHEYVCISRSRIQWVIVKEFLRLYWGFTVRRDYMDNAAKIHTKISPRMIPLSLSYEQQRRDERSKEPRQPTWNDMQNSENLEHGS